MTSSLALQPNACLRPSPQTFRGHISGFLVGSFLQGGVVNPTPNPQPGGPGPIFITPGTMWPNYTSRHRVPNLVTFYLKSNNSIVTSQQWTTYNIKRITGINSHRIVDTWILHQGISVVRRNESCNEARVWGRGEPGSEASPPSRSIHVTIIICGWHALQIVLMTYLEDYIVYQTFR